VVSSKVASTVCATWMLVVGAVLLRAEPPQKRGDPVNERVRGSIDRPAQVNPTDDRVRQHIKLPDGFRHGRFADDSRDARMLPDGCAIVRVDFDDAGKPLKIEPFATGCLVDDRASKWSHPGRLAGCAFSKDGSLLVSDDANGVIYRIASERSEAASGRD
jgi:hypothetical protein